MVYKKTLGIIILMIFPLMILFSQGVLACAVCYSGRDESIGAFYLSTAVLTTLPLTIIGGIGAWIYYQYKKSDQ